MKHHFLILLLFQHKQCFTTFLTSCFLFYYILVFYHFGFIWTYAYHLHFWHIFCFTNTPMCHDMPGFLTHELLCFPSYMIGFLWTEYLVNLKFVCWNLIVCSNWEWTWELLKVVKLGWGIPKWGVSSLFTNHPESHFLFSHVRICWNMNT